MRPAGQALERVDARRAHVVLGAAEARERRVVDAAVRAEAPATERRAAEGATVPPLPRRRTRRRGQRADGRRAPALVPGSLGES